MKRVIFDCDNTMGLLRKEIDDGLTVYYLLGRPDIDLVGVTTTFGNGTIEQVYPQTKQLLAEIGRSDIPVARGAGKRGEGPTDAARFLVEAVNAQPGEISILATGPLGNLRAALELDSEFFSKIKQIACMGGYLSPLRMGWRDVGELNLSADPEASHAVLNAPCPVVLMNAQVCLQAPFGWADLRKLDFWSRRTRSYVRNWLILHGIGCGLSHFYLWDLLPALYISRPELFEQNEVRITSTIEDLDCGTLVLDESEREANVNMPMAITDIEGFMQTLFEAWEKLEV